MDEKRDEILAHVFDNIERFKCLRDVLKIQNGDDE